MRDRFQSPPPENYYSSIDVEMPKTTYQVGKRLNFTINTHGVCASPNVTITRNDEVQGEAPIAYEYRGSFVRWPPSEAPDQPYLIWQGVCLTRTYSNEYFGGNGDSKVTTNAAITLKTAGKYGSER